MRKINREILSLALPNILSNISVPLISSVDTSLMGHLSTAHLAAIGISSMIFNFVYWNFGFLRMGTTGMTAQAYGEKDSDQISNTLFRAGMIALLLALILMIFYKPLLGLGASVMNIDPNHVSYVNEYVDMRIWAAPATFMLYVLFGWFFGMQNAIYPLILTIIINVVNIGLSSYFVIGLDMGIRGAALGTVISQYTGLTFALGLLLYKYRTYVEQFSISVILAYDAFRRFLAINQNLFLRTVCLTLAFGFFYSQSSKAGALILASNIILLQFVNWMSYGIDGFAYASESLVGKYYGAKDKKNLDASISASFLMGGGLAILFSLIYWAFGRFFLTVFTSEPDVIQFGESMLWWMVVLPIIAFASYLWDGIYIGLTASRTMRNTMLASFLCYLGAFYFLDHFYPSKHVLWVALSIFLIIRALSQWWYYHKYGDKLT